MTKFSVKKPFTIFVVVIAIAIFGVLSYTKMVPDLLPNMDFPYFIIVTTYPGASPEEVETTITRPMEQSMATLNNIKNLSSTSSENYAMLMLEFEEETNMDSATVDILQKIQLLEGNWDDMVGTPSIIRINPSMLPVMVAGVESDNMDRYELGQFASDTLLAELEGTTGLASIEAGGLVKREITVKLSDKKLDALNEKIEKALLSSLAEARQKLEDAQKEIDDAKAQVDYGTYTLRNAPKKMLDGAKDIGGGGDLGSTLKEAVTVNLELSAAEVIRDALSAELETYTTTLGQMQSAVTDLDMLLANIAAERQALAPAVEAGAELEDTTPLTELGLEDAELEALTALGYSTLGEVRQRDTELKATEDSTSEALSSARSALAEAQAAADLRLPDLNEEIATNAARLNELQAQAAANAAKIADIQAGLTQLPEKLAGGIVEISLAGGQLAAAKTALESAQTTLDGANENYDKQVEAALKAADMHNVLTLELLSSLIGAQNFDMPAGYVYNGELSEIVSVGNGILSISELKSLPLMDMGIDGLEPVCLDDVADLEFADNGDEIYASLNGETSLVLTFSKQSNYATAQVSDNIRAKFAELEEKYPGLHFASLVDQGDYIYLIRDSILSSLLWGALFSVLILYLFLRDWRPTVITLFSIPISLLFAVTLMYFSGISLNIMSLSGLAISVGMLVDNSIVVIENTYRLRNAGESPMKAAVSGATQVGGAVAASTLTTICVFVPIAFVTGLIRTVITDMMLTLSFTLVASLVVALTLVPALTGKLLKDEKQKKEGSLDRLMTKYRGWVLWGVGHKAVILLLSVALLLGSFGLLMTRGFTFLPEMEMEQMTVYLTAPEGMEFAELCEQADEAASRMAAVYGVKTVGGSAGGSGGISIGGVTDTSDVTFYVLLDQDINRKLSDVAKDINEACADLKVEVKADSNSIMALMVSFMTGSGVTVRLYGNDLNELQKGADAIAERLQGVEGVSEVSTGKTDPSPELHFTVDKLKAAEKGLTVAQVYMEVAKAVTGNTELMKLTDDGAGYTVFVETAGKDKLTEEFIENYSFIVTDKTGEEETVYLKDIAKLERSSTPSTISRLEQRRYLDVTATVDKEHNITKVTDACEAALEGLELPDSVEMAFSGERESIMDAMVDLVKLMAVGIALVYLVMVAQFQDLKSPFIVMFTIPLAFTGGFLALYLFGMELNVLSMLGLIMLVGIIVNNGIVLVDYINQLRLGGMSRQDAIADAAVTRLRPILMTTITTVLGLIVMALGQNEATSLVQPLAVTCIGGLCYATLMTLFVVPVMYDMLSKKELYKVEEEDLVESTL